ncbi:MAG: calcium/sodium antiporter [Leptospiraceae bacterium]|nr:calcium/sodium antiporter [Leptospiraceae bacterium]MCP5496724.1 calcium/sodium antiporter [Leptospiraceae bacterium]
MILIISKIIGGLLLLLVGGEGLVRGSVILARIFGLSTLVIGLTVVSMGTSAPELVVCIQSALSGHSDIAIGNVIGSNISNIFLIIGLTACIYPIHINKKLLKFDAPMLLLYTVLLVLFCLGDFLYRLEGLFLVGSIIFYNWYTVKKVRKQPEEDIDVDVDLKSLEKYKWWHGVLLVFMGILALAYGSDVLVEGSVALAKIYGVSEAVIGLTIVAVGTSMPEMITSAVAAYRKEADIALGNVVGSNLFNILGILGVTAVVKPIPISPEFLQRDSWVLILSTLLLVGLMKTQEKFDKFAGIVFLVFYASYTIFLIYQRNFL